MKTRKIITLSIIAFLVLLISTLFMPFSFPSKKANDSYEYVIKDSITNMNAKITDIALLGAHDAFTSGITRKSEPDYNGGGITTNRFLNSIAKGAMIRMSKTQNVSAKELLYAGVRYFDVRITKVESEYYAFHGYLSYKLDTYIEEITDFLSTHNGEYIIFDIQHFETENGLDFKLPLSDYQELMEYLDDKGLIDYCRYDSSTPIGDLRYTNVTKGGSEAGCIILAKSDAFSKFYVRDNDASYKKTNYYSIRSLWHDTNSFSKLYKGIEEEYEYLTENDYSSVLVVNQAQLTGLQNGISLVGSMCSWSLIDMAASSNKKLVKDEAKFKKWLEVMPIFMVDYATSNRGNFNYLANKYIKEYNQTL